MEAAEKTSLGRPNYGPVWRKHFLAAGAELFSAVYIP